LILGKLITKFANLGNKKADGKLHGLKDNIQEEETFTRPLLI
jgi:hypothetical protein